MTVRISVAAQAAARDAVTLLADAGSGAGLLRIYSGAQPATPATAASGTLLAEFTLDDPAWASGTLQSTPLSTVGVGDDDAGWFRVVDSDINPVFDGSVTATGGGGDVTLDNISIASGQGVNLVSLAVSEPME